jgi:hypothetical protein
VSRQRAIEAAKRRKLPTKDQFSPPLTYTWTFLFKKRIKRKRVL